MSGADSHFADRLIDTVERAGSCACVGLDPVMDRLPEALRPRELADRGACASAIESFCMFALDAIAGRVGVVKPQSACFERFGWEGVRTLERVCAGARDRGFVVVLDVKRGDIGITAEHYASGAFDLMGADAATVNAYLGADTLDPWLGWKPRAPSEGDRRGRGLFVLVRTSNPGSDGVQSTRVTGGAEGTIAERMARLVHDAGVSRLGEREWSDVGAVVGATKPADAARLRELMPHTPLLVPGWGAQGGDAATVGGLLAPRPAGGRVVFRGAIVSASRSVLYAFERGDSAWRTRIADAAARFADELRAI